VFSLKENKVIVFGQYIYDSIQYLRWNFHFPRKTPMVVVIGTQFDKLTTRLDRVVEAIVSGNMLTENMSQVALHQVVATEKRNELMHEQVTILRRSSTIQYQS